MFGYQGQDAASFCVELFAQPGRPRFVIGNRVNEFGLRRHMELNLAGRHFRSSGSAMLLACGADLQQPTFRLSENLLGGNQPCRIALDLLFPVFDFCAPCSLEFSRRGGTILIFRFETIDQGTHQASAFLVRQ
jgi:hypothetical protein